MYQRHTRCHLIPLNRINTQLSELNRLMVFQLVQTHNISWEEGAFTGENQKEKIDTWPFSCTPGPEVKPWGLLQLKMVVFAFDLKESKILRPNQPILLNLLQPLRESPSKDIELFTKICTKLPAFISSFGELLSWSTYASVYINSQNILKLSCFIMFMVCRLHMIKHFASQLTATTIIQSNELFFKGTIM